MIAAVVVGGTALSGRTRLDARHLARRARSSPLIGNGLVLLGVNPFIQDVVRGVIIVTAVLLNTLLGKRNGQVSD